MQHRRRATEHDAGQGHQHEPGRLRPLRPVDPGSDRRRARARRGRRGRPPGTRRVDVVGFRAGQLQRRDHRRRAHACRRPHQLFELRPAHRPDRAGRRPAGRPISSCRFRTPARRCRRIRPTLSPRAPALPRRCVSGTAALMLARDPLLTPGACSTSSPGRRAASRRARLHSAESLRGGHARRRRRDRQHASRRVAAGQRRAASSSITAPTSTTISSPPTRPRSTYVDTFLAGTFQRTGLYFYAYLDSASAPPGAMPVCRFYASEAVQINSHYYSANLDECLFVLAQLAGHLDARVGDARSTFRCRTAMATARRRRCRCTVSSTTGAMPITATRSICRCGARCRTAPGSPEGDGPNGVAFCSTI